MAVFEGHLAGAGRRFAVAVARFNSLISQKLLEGCLDALRRHGVADDDVDVAWVPGSFELPVAARRLAASARYDAVVALGALIRGETPHFDHIASACASGLARVSVDTEVPVLFGVLTVDSMDQALARAGGKAGNKGAEAAVAAVEMADLFSRLGKRK